MMKKINAVLIFILWLLFIFLNSSKVGSESTAMSDNFIEKTSFVFKVFSIRDHHVVSFIVRKSAHFIEYVILALLLLNLNISFKNSLNILLLGLLVFLLAATDEYHQTFVEGRSGEIRDVLFDTSAGMLTLYMVNLYLKENKVK